MAALPQSLAEDGWKGMVLTMDNRPIGVFDSGLGGLTVVRQMFAALPHERIIYFGDTGRVPYGTRSRETIEKYARQDSRFLLGRGVKLIIAACGTVSSVAPHVLDALPVPALGVVEPAADAALRATRSGRIGVLGTPATIRSQAFERRLTAAGVRAYTQACPLFVPLVENGWIRRDDEVTRLTAARYLGPLRDKGIDTLILGCTHFPLLTDILSDILGPGVRLIDAGREAAAACLRCLRESDSLCGDENTGGGTFYVSDRPEDFSHVAGIFLGREVEGDVHTVEIEDMENGDPA